MPISVASPRPEARGLARALRELVRLTLAGEGLRGGAIGVALSGDRELRELNRRYRDLDRATDVLSFDYGVVASRAAAAKRAAATVSPVGSGGTETPERRVARPAPAEDAPPAASAARPGRLRLALEAGSARPALHRPPEPPGEHLLRSPARLATRPRPVNGDLAISLDRVAEQASRFRCTRGRELARLVVHGTLHLAGLDHRTAPERRHMRRREEAALRRARAAVAALERRLDGTTKRRPS